MTRTDKLLYENETNKILEARETELKIISQKLYTWEMKEEYKTSSKIVDYICYNAPLDFIKVDYSGGYDKGGTYIMIYITLDLPTDYNETHIQSAEIQFEDIITKILD
jgi:hypothetical protein